MRPPSRSARWSRLPVALLTCLLAVVLPWCLLGPRAGPATARLSALPGGGRSILIAGTLDTAVASTPLHPTVTATSAGNVRTTWSVVLSRAVIFAVQRASTSTPTTWTTVNGNGSASGSVCAGTVPGTVSCTYLDTSAVYGGQYVYRVVSTLGGWTSTSGSQLALSLKAASATLRSPADLHGIAAAAANSAWAVGNNCTVDHWNGTSWIAQAVPTTVCPPGTTLDAVFAAGGFPVIGGHYGVAFGCLSSCTTAAPNWYAKATGQINLTAIYATSGTTIFGVGELCTAMYYDQSTNQIAIISPPQPLCGSRTLRAVHGVGASNLVVVGDGGLLLVCTANCTTAAASWSAPAVSPAVTGTPTYWGAWSGDANSVIVVGDGGRMIGCTANCGTSAGTWGAVPPVTAARLRSVTGLAGGKAYAVGDGGAAAACTGSCASAVGDWSVVDSGTTADLASVALVGGNAWAVGAEGVARTSSGGSPWSSLTPAVPTAATSTTLGATEVTATTKDGDSAVLGGRFTWPAAAASTTCVGTAVELAPTAVVPTGAWTVGRTQAVVRAAGNAAPGSGASLRLLVSGDAGGSWTSYPLTLPGGYGSYATSTVDVTATIATTGHVSSMRWCLTGSSGSGVPLTTWLDLVHVDIN